VLSLHVSTTAERFSVSIHRDGATEELVHHAEGLPGAWHDTPLDAYERGCRWPVSVEIPILPEWRTGGYVIELTTDDPRGSVTQEGFFALRPLAGKESLLAVVLATYTWQEYNDWGGGSGYSLDPIAGHNDVPGGLENQKTLAGFAPRLSYERPWARGLVRLPIGAPRAVQKHAPPIGGMTRYEQCEWAFANGYSLYSGTAGWDRFDAFFVRWAERQGYQLDVLTQWDLDQSRDLLDPYRCVVTVGHDEYWTASGREQLDRFIEDGGSYLRLAGNIVWQIRLEDGGRKQVCYKFAPEADPAYDSDDHRLRTGACQGSHIDRPPVTTFGANATGYARFGGAAPRSVGGLIVYRNDHWVFAGTDLYYGDVLGASVPLVAYEVDGVAYTIKDGLPYATGEDGAPEGLEILALTPATYEEEDHRARGSFLAIGDGDLAIRTKRLLGSDTPEGRERLRRTAAAMTWMKKGVGQVLCGSSTEWPYALSQAEPMIERIVRNALDRFTSA
jgi:hypothetical protein